MVFSNDDAFKRKFENNSTEEKKHASVNRDRETELAKILLDVIYPPRENVAKRRRSECVLTKQCYEKKKKRTYYHTSESFETHKKIRSI